jgi:hypothetical protein
LLELQVIPQILRDKVISQHDAASLPYEEMASEVRLYNLLGYNAG